MTKQKSSAQKDRVALGALVAADTISRIGDVMTATAIPWFVLVTTGSASKTGITVFAVALAVVISLFFGGVAVDRIGYRRTSIFGDIASGATVGLIPLLHFTAGLPYPLLVALVFLGTLLDLPAQVARYSALPDAAQRAGVPFERANALFEGGITLGSLVGPALAGLLIAAFGAANALWIDVGTFALSAILVATRVPGDLSLAHTEDLAGRSFRSALGTGLRFVRNEPLLFPLILFFAAMNLAIGPVEALLLPVYANDVFNSAVALGFMTATLTLGALAGNVVAGWVGHRLPRRQVLLLGFLVLPLGVLALAPLPQMIVVLPILACIGFALSLTNMVEYAIYFERIPGSMRARILGITAAIGWVSVPLGRLIFGFLLDWLSLGNALLVLGLVALPIPFSILAVPSLRAGLARPVEPAVDTTRE